MGQRLRLGGALEALVILQTVAMPYVASSGGLGSFSYAASLDVYGDVGGARATLAAMAILGGELLWGLGEPRQKQGWSALS